MRRGQSTSTTTTTTTSSISPSPASASQSNGWTRQDYPSYMVGTPPSSLASWDELDNKKQQQGGNDNDHSITSATTNGDGTPRNGSFYSNHQQTPSSSSSILISTPLLQSRSSTLLTNTASRRRRTPILKKIKKKTKQNDSLLKRIAFGGWLFPKGSSSSSLSKSLSSSSSFTTICIAVALWYTLGVVSIATSKLILTRGTPPLFLTLQQLFLGSNMLNTLLHILQAFGILAGLQPWPQPPTESTPTFRRQREKQGGRIGFGSMLDIKSLWYVKDLILSGVFFSLGFLGTNISFSGASAAFVETVKAAEPITSAAVAVMWGIEVLSFAEGASLGGIVTGVLLSTLGNVSSSADDEDKQESVGDLILSKSLQSCCIVMMTNLCFSFRGLYQKLFRASSFGSKNVMDDLNLQFRMQQIGMALLILPVLVWDSNFIISSAGTFFNNDNDDNGWEDVLEYMMLAALNGFAFTSYNLASTFVLTRISVVHHAALNCIRRIFAIVITSIYFGLPITILGAIGIMVSFAGFMSFTHYKVKRQQEPKPISTLLPMSAI